ncbi:MAG: FecR family protein [Pseudomonadota bacterium]
MTELHDVNDPIEQLLRQAPPRRSPPDAHAREVRAAVQAQWQTQVRARRRRHLAVAATMAAATLIAAVNFAPGFRAQPAVLAEVTERVGRVAVINARGERIGAGEPLTLHQGQRITTEAGAVLALRWHDGSIVKLGEASRVEMISDSVVRLASGRLYFDSAVSERGRLDVLTERGTVRHIGTQYLAEMTDGALTVSVREGSVAVDAPQASGTISAGAALRYDGRGAPVRLDARSMDWSWVDDAEALAGSQSAHEFLTWVAVKTGYDVEYAQDGARELALRTLLVGEVSSAPLLELEIRMLTTDLRYTLDERRRKIVVTLAEAPGP